METPKNPFTDCHFDTPVDQSELELVESLNDLKIGGEYTFDFNELPLTGEILSIGKNFKKPNGEYFNAIIVLARSYRYLIADVK